MAKTRDELKKTNLDLLIENEVNSNPGLEERLYKATQSLEIEAQIYKLLFDKSIVDGVRILHEDQWPVEELSLLVDKAIQEASTIDENTSDGYHTFKELYDFRKVYNAVLFNEWSKQGKYNVHKSWKHSDGELCFGGGWFIVMANMPTGQISNHYEAKDWNLFQCEVREKADEWDGHTAQDALERLLKFSQQKV